MTAFTNDSIDELDRLARDTDNVFRMTRGGYALATRRKDVSSFMDDIVGDIDIDIISSRHVLRQDYAMLSDQINNVIHIRRGGDFSGQQLGQYMLEKIRDAGGSRITGDVVAIEKGAHYSIEVAGSLQKITTDMIVNAAGPFAGKVAQMLGTKLPITNVYQQKIAFEDRLGAIPRDMPFSIDLDAKTLAWSQEERDLLLDDVSLAWLAKELPAGSHCRPEGGAHGQWVKLGWAYNESPSEPQVDLANEPAIDAQFPEIVIRGAAAFIPSLRPYIDAPPARYSHYGGYYTMTAENWPIIGPQDGDGAFVIAALSGFGSMSACAAGKLCADYVGGDVLPDYAANLSLSRYDDADLMAQLLAANKGLL
jgi:glycine/D-amino acid oxidase-like deaminating enzyme